MKVHIKKYPNWFGSYHVAHAVMFFLSEEKREDYSLDFADTFIGQQFDRISEKVYNWFESKRVNVKVHPYDSIDASSTLAYVIVPVLKQLKESKRGCSRVDDCDVPDPIKRSPESEDNFDQYFEARWSYVIDEMIFAFEEIIKDDLLLKPQDQIAQIDERIANGLRLFGKYYRALWS